MPAKFALTLIILIFLGGPSAAEYKVMSSISAQTCSTLDQELKEVKYVSRIVRHPASGIGRLFGKGIIVCRRYTIEASGSGGSLYALPDIFPDSNLMEYRNGRCWHHFPTGILGKISGYISNRPDFYTVNDAGSYVKIGSPEYLYFECLKI